MFYSYSMKSKHIIQEPHKTLRTIASPIKPNEITSEKIKKTITIMRDEMYASGDGVAIAAPQINVPVRMFMVAGFVFDKRAKYVGDHGSPDRVFINPEIIKSSKAKKNFPGEGCLSVRYVYGTTKRSTHVTVRATDEHGVLFTMSASGFLAQVFQHEIDHLNGILFIDHATQCRKMETEEIKDYEQELAAIVAKRNNHAK